MKFLIDNALSPKVSQALRKAGFDSVHVREIALHKAEDSEIFSRAISDDRIIISADTVFSTLLALWRFSKPSIILFRRGLERRTQQQVALLLSNLPHIRESLEKGSIVIFDQHRIRIRSLPVST